IAKNAVIIKAVVMLFVMILSEIEKNLQIFKDILNFYSY
ncbi:hypothetical protein LCGC14_1539970, partial [marine sediment metagenome]